MSGTEKEIELTDTEKFAMMYIAERQAKLNDEFAKLQQATEKITREIFESREISYEEIEDAELTSDLNKIRFKMKETHS